MLTQDQENTLLHAEVDKLRYELEIRASNDMEMISESGVDGISKPRSASSSTVGKVFALLRLILMSFYRQQAT